MAAVLFGVRGAQDYWSLQTQGHNAVYADGKNQWRPSPDKDHAYLTNRMPNSELQVVLEELLRKPPGQL